jgi:hypothetical protein
VQYACQHGVGLGRSGGAARALGFQQREQAAWGTAAPRAMCWSSDGAVSATPGSVQGGDQLLGAEGAAGGGAGAGMRLISSSKQKYMQPMEGATCGGGGVQQGKKARHEDTHSPVVIAEKRSMRVEGLQVAGLAPRSQQGTGCKRRASIRNKKRLGWGR